MQRLINTLFFLVKDVSRSQPGANTRPGWTNICAKGSVKRPPLWLLLLF